MGEIILTIAFFVMGVAAGYTWRERISRSRRAKQRERVRRRRLAAANEMNSNASSTSVLTSLENPPAREPAGSRDELH
ncbi:MAG: hypothetical protein P4M05_22380 [Bradyrhizobium sp.]|nr:hypothetical protein [Bradyrhizobium sp.]